MFPKTFRVSDTGEWRWKIVSGERTGLWERTLADLSATMRLNVLSGVVGSQTWPHLVDGDGTHHVNNTRTTQEPSYRATCLNWFGFMSLHLRSSNCNRQQQDRVKVAFAERTFVTQHLQSGTVYGQAWPSIRCKRTAELWFTKKILFI